MPALDPHKKTPPGHERWRPVPKIGVERYAAADGGGRQNLDGISPAVTVAIAAEEIEAQDDRDGELRAGDHARGEEHLRQPSDHLPKRPRAGKSEQPPRRNNDR
jgi:hypothetical protein